MRVVLAVVWLAGCNAIYGLEPTTTRPPADADTRPDRDHDGIADAEDPCIAGEFELTLDFDGDGLTLDDPCPFDAEATDQDTDGIPDACDPFPQLAGDRRRCVSTFANTDLSTALWQARANELPWVVHPGSIRSNFDEVRSALAAEILEAPVSTTFEIRGYQLHNSGDTMRSLAFWIRGGPAPSAADVWCSIRSDNTASQVVIERGDQPNAIASAMGPAILSTTTFRIAITIEPDGTSANLACRVELAGSLTTLSLTARGRLAVPAGTFGFYASNIFTSVQRLSIFDREAAAL